MPRVPALLRARMSLRDPPAAATSILPAAAGRVSPGRRAARRWPIVRRFTRRAMSGPPAARRFQAVDWLARIDRTPAIGPALAAIGPASATRTDRPRCLGTGPAAAEIDRAATVPTSVVAIGLAAAIVPRSVAAIARVAAIAQSLAAAIARAVPVAATSTSATTSTSAIDRAAATSLAIVRAGIGPTGTIPAGVGAGVVAAGPATGTTTASARITAGTTAAGTAIGAATGTRRSPGAPSVGGSAR